MNTLAYDGPGPWILFFPLVWAAVILTVVTLVRRTVRRGGRGPWGPPFGGPRSFDDRPSLGERSPLAVLGRRFAAGEIDEEEYWRRLSVLNEEFGRRESGAA